MHHHHTVATPCQPRCRVSITTQRSLIPMQVSESNASPSPACVRPANRPLANRPLFAMDTINDREFWEEFLAMYRSFTCLWDRKCPQYSDRHYRDEACAALVAKCKERYPKATRNMVVKKIHSFRCSFRRELKKVMRSRKSGVDTYVPNLWYYDLLSFIIDSVIPREGAADSPEEDQDGNPNHVKRKKRGSNNAGQITSFHVLETPPRTKHPRTTSSRPHNHAGLFLEEQIKQEAPETEEMPEEHELPVCAAAQEEEGACPASDPQQEEHNLRMKTLIMKHQMKEGMWRREMQMREDEHTMKMRVLEAQLMYYQNAMGCSRMHMADEATMETLDI